MSDLTCIPAIGPDMATIQRQRVTWTGFAGGPGISTFYFLDAAAHQTALYDFLTGMVGGLPTDVTLQIESSGDTIVAETGVLSATWQGVGQFPVIGTSLSAYAAPAGYEVQWNSDAVLFGRRGRGRTFFVPAAQSVFDVDGTVLTAVVADFGAKAQTFVNAVPGNMLIWSRPRVATPAWTDVRGVTHPAIASRAGYTSPVTNAKVPDKAVILSSRRD